MKPVIILFHMAVFSLLILFTLIGLAGAEQNGGGYLWRLLVIGSPFVMGMQVMLVINLAESGE